MALISEQKKLCPQHLFFPCPEESCGWCGLHGEASSVESIPSSLGERREHQGLAAEMQSIPQDGSSEKEVSQPLGHHQSH